ncbi:MAG: hypothetical protein ACPGXL_00870 [Chitinophagales bacterium]
MKNVTIACCMILCFILTNVACSSGGFTVDPAQQKATIDSLIEVKQTALMDSIVQACQGKMENDVVAKSDSIIAAMTKK